MDDPALPPNAPPPARNPVKRMALLVLGFAMMVVAPITAPVPGPGATLLFAAGLAIVLRNSTWAKRVFARVTRRWPRLGRITDWGLRRPNAPRGRRPVAAEQPD